MRCLSRNCQTERAENSRFCAYHQRVFAAIAAEINEDGRAALRSRERYARQSRLCDVPGCDQTALAREPYCARHQQMMLRRAQD